MPSATTLQPQETIQARLALGFNAYLTLQPREMESPISVLFKNEQIMNGTVVRSDIIGKAYGQKVTSGTESINVQGVPYKNVWTELITHDHVQRWNEQDAHRMLVKPDARLLEVSRLGVRESLDIEERVPSIGGLVQKSDATDATRTGLKVALPSKQQIPIGATQSNPNQITSPTTMTVAKLLLARNRFVQGSTFNRNIYAIMNPHQVAALLSEARFTSADYVMEKSIPSGRMHSDVFGIKIIEVPDYYLKAYYNSDSSGSINIPILTSDAMILRRPTNYRRVNVMMIPTVRGIPYQMAYEETEGTARLLDEAVVMVSCSQPTFEENPLKLN